MTEVMSNLRILSGNSNPQLAVDIAAALGIELLDAKVSRFNNGETQVMINESIRGKDIFIIQPTCQPVNDSLMELLIMADACKRASAQTVTAVVPYYAYARQDRKTRGREPISAKLVANLMTAAGITRVLTVDLHAGQIQGFFDIPVDHLAGGPAMAKWVLKTMDLKDTVVVSPDLGGVTRARKFADILNTPIAIVEKRRPEPGKAEVMNVIGSIEGKTCIMVDDIVDSAGSLCAGANALMKLGAKEVMACCSHGILSGNAVEKVNESALKKLIVTDTIPLSEEAKQCDKIVSVTLAPMLADFIGAIYNRVSVSKLFYNNN